MKLAACVVLYYPEDSLLSNIDSYKDYVSTIYVVDNSERSNMDLVSAIVTDKKIKYIPLTQNLGIAKALNIGCEAALNDGYDWILTMDQDSSVICTRIFNVSEPTLESYNVAIVAARHTEHLPKVKEFQLADFNLIKTVITSGNVLNLKAWRNVHGFNENFFIDEVDNEFCLRLNDYGYKILVTKKISLSHNLGEQYSKGLAAFRKLSKHSPLRMYYMTRNNLYLWKKYFFKDTSFILERIITYFKSLLKIIFFFPDKKTYLKFVTKGTKDFLNSKFGPYNDD
jgi:rhamnosyltransferase